MNNSPGSIAIKKDQGQFPSYAFMVIRSGLQTGADRAGVDAGIDLGFPYHCYIPATRKAEDGRIPDTYTCVVETKSANYPERTEKNVEQSDATLIFIKGQMGRGSELTKALCVKHSKPYQVIDLNNLTPDNDPSIIAQWIVRKGVYYLNIAGSRESTCPGIYKQAKDFVSKVLRILLEA